MTRLLHHRLIEITLQNWFNALNAQISKYSRLRVNFVSKHRKMYKQKDLGILNSFHIS